MTRVLLLSSLTSALVAAAVTALLMVWVAPHLIGTSDIVRAERFEVVDPQGHVTARFGGPANNDALTILDRQGTERVGLRLLADGTSLLFLADGQGRVRANVYVNAPGTATAVQLFDTQGMVARSLNLVTPGP